MTKYINHLVKPLVFLERGGLGLHSTEFYGCKEVINVYFVGAYTRKQGLAILRNQFGPARTFFMANGYGNNRQTEKLTTDEAWNGSNVNKLRLPLGKITDFNHLPKVFNREFDGQKMPEVVRESIKNEQIALTDRNFIN